LNKMNSFCSYRHQKFCSRNPFCPSPDCRINKMSSNCPILARPTFCTHFFQFLPFGKIIQNALLHSNNYNKENKNPASESNDAGLIIKGEFYKLNC
jgi:hypothetical protein